MLETISPHVWNVEVEGKIVATRKQIPLKLAWAMSIHKVDCFQQLYSNQNKSAKDKP